MQNTYFQLTDVLLTLVILSYTLLPFFHFSSIILKYLTCTLCSPLELLISSNNILCLYSKKSVHKVCLKTVQKLNTEIYKLFKCWYLVAIPPISIFSDERRSTSSSSPPKPKRECTLIIIITTISIHSIFIFIFIIIIVIRIIGKIFKTNVYNSRYMRINFFRTSA